MKITELTADLERFDEKVNFTNRSLSVEMNFMTPESSARTFETLEKISNDPNLVDILNHFDMTNGLRGPNSASASIKEIAKRFSKIASAIRTLENSNQWRV